MPTYKNNTSKSITEKIEVSMGQLLNIVFAPGEQKALEYVLTNAGLTLVSATPYHNPIVLVETISSDGVGDDQTVAINFDAHILSIFNPSSVLVTCFLQSTDNIPGLPIYSSMERLIDINHTCSQIILVFSAAASVYVEQRRN